MADEPRKRSRFDQTEPDPPRRSGFDRRSRSPDRRDSQPQRERSPVNKTGDSPAGGERKDAAAAAAAAAAKINASINAKKGVQQVDVPPIRAGSMDSPSAGPPTIMSPTSGELQKEIYQQDGDYIKDIEVNDLRNRYTLTKGSTQKMIKDKTGADVTSRGSYYPDKSMATATNPPLYLHITSQSKDGLEAAVQEIEEMMKQELPNLIDERRFKRREQPEQPERDERGRKKWPEERIPIDLEPIPGFNLRAQVVGQGGQYVKYIQSETGCRVQIKGRGSGFLEHDTGRESDEQMYLHVAGPDPNEVEKAKGYSLELLESVRQNYEAFKERPPRNAGGQGGYNQRDRNGSDSYGGQQQDQYGYGAQQQQGYGGGAQSPTSAAQQQQQQTQDPAEQQAQMLAWIDYYNKNPSQDPYIQYGGYAAMMQYYGYGTGAGDQQQQGGYGAAGSPAQQQQNGGGAYGVPPPPPPPGDEQAPPPPPGGDGGGYNAAPPPPGL